MELITHTHRYRVTDGQTAISHRAVTQPAVFVTSPSGHPASSYQSTGGQSVWGRRVASCRAAAAAGEGVVRGHDSRESPAGAATGLEPVREATVGNQ